MQRVAWAKETSIGGMQKGKAKWGGGLLKAKQKMAQKYSLHNPVVSEKHR
jgi:hypothetical protein